MCVKATNVNVHNCITNVFKEYDHITFVTQNDITKTQLNEGIEFQNTRIYSSKLKKK